LGRSPRVLHDHLPTTGVGERVELHLVILGAAADSRVTDPHRVVVLQGVVHVSDRLGIRSRNTDRKDQPAPTSPELPARGQTRPPQQLPRQKTQRPRHPPRRSAHDPHPPTATPSSMINLCYVALGLSQAGIVTHSAPPALGDDVRALLHLHGALTARRAGTGRYRFRAHWPAYVRRSDSGAWSTRNIQVAVIALTVHPCACSAVASTYGSHGEHPSWAPSTIYG
jgi:hypothetical protein